MQVKSASDMLNRVRRLYQSIRTAELEAAQDPQVGADAITEFVEEAGFLNYQDFATEALFVETGERAKHLGRASDPGLGAFSVIRARLKDMDAAMSRIRELLRFTQGTQTNLVIQGGRLQTGTETLKVIAQNYALLSRRIGQSIAGARASLDELNLSVQEGRRGYFAYALLSEAIPLYAAGQAADNQDPDGAEAAALREALAGFEASITSSFSLVASKVAAFQGVAVDLKRVASGLAMTRVMCRMEAARIVDEAHGIDEISNQLERFQKNLGEVLDTILVTCASLTSTVEMATEKDTATAAETSAGTTAEMSAETAAARASGGTLPAAPPANTADAPAAKVLTGL